MNNNPVVLRTNLPKFLFQTPQKFKNGRNKKNIELKSK